MTNPQVLVDSGGCKPYEVLPGPTREEALEQVSDLIRLLPEGSRVTIEVGPKQKVCAQKPWYFLVTTHPVRNPLTPSQARCLSLAAEGLSDKGIAARYFLSANTVATHLKACFKRLSVHTREDAVLIARQNGWLKPTMRLSCPNQDCDATVDPNEDSTKWAPPTSKMSKSIGAIVCPTCGRTNDFLDWQMQTAEPKVQQPTS